MDPRLELIYGSILGGDMKATPAHVQTTLDSGDDSYWDKLCSISRCIRATQIG